MRIHEMGSLARTAGISDYLRGDGRAWLYFVGC